MRSVLAVVALLITAGIAAEGQQTKGKDAPTDEDIINMVGGRLFKLFAQFGTPEDLRTVRSEETPEMDTVLLEYGAFAFNVRQKTVQACYFLTGWKGKIKGINLGDSREQVVKALGDEYENSEIKNDDGVHDYLWELKENGGVLWVTFDKNDRVKRVAVVLK